MPISMRIVSALVLTVAIAQSGHALPLPSHPSKKPSPAQSSASGINWQTAFRPHYVAGDTISMFVEEAWYRASSGGGSDCWGWEAPDGTEYAIMGERRGLTIVNVTHGKIADTLLGPYEGICGSAYWRDMATYQNYLYCVSECEGENEGLQVIDLQYLPDSVRLVGTFPISDQGIMTSHNLCIDSVAGFLYAVGNGWANTAMFIHSLADPASPTYVGGFGEIPLVGYYSVHDMYADNDTVYVANAQMSTWSIWDLTDKQNAVELSRVSLSGFPYVHNIWPTDDRNYVVTTEETPYQTVKIWDIRTLNDVRLVSQYLAPGNLAHNAHVVGDRVYLAHYESGLVVLDISDKENPLEIAREDTYVNGEGSGYHGAWGVFPHTNTGHVYVSNVDGRLFVFQETLHALSDSVIIGDAALAEAGLSIKVPVIAQKSVEIRDIRFAVTWAGPLNMVFDSASTSGLATASLPVQSLTSFDAFNSRLGYRMAVASDDTLLPIGRDTVLFLYFTTTTGDSGTVNPVTLTEYSSNVVAFATPGFDIDPDTMSGSVTIDASQCCVGTRGNIDGDVGDQVTIQDLTILVGFMFSQRQAPPCEAEMNVNGNPENTIDISDLTHMVDYMFRGGEAPANCP